MKHHHLSLAALVLTATLAGCVQTQETSLVTPPLPSSASEADCRITNVRDVGLRMSGKDGVRESIEFTVNLRDATSGQSSRHAIVEPKNALTVAAYAGQSCKIIMSPGGPRILPRS